MRKEQVKLSVGIVVILAHVISMGSIAFIGRTHLLFEQVVDLLLVLSPIFSAYTLVIVKELVASGTVHRKGKLANAGYLFVSFLFPISFGVTLVAIVWSIPRGDISVEHAKRALGVTETLFGAYLSVILGDLFGPIPTKEPKDK